MLFTLSLLWCGVLSVKGGKTWFWVKSRPKRCCWAPRAVWGCKMGFIQSLWQESRPNVGIGEEEHEGKSRKEGKAELLPRAVTWKGWDAPKLSRRIRQPREARGVRFRLSPSKARSHFPSNVSQPISSLLALILGRAWGFFFFPRFGGKNPSNPKALGAVQVVFLGNELFPSSSGAQSVALCALPAIEELGSLLGATIPLQAAVPGDFRGVFCSVCGNERGAGLAAVPAAGVVHFEPHKTVYFEFLASF